MLRINLLPSYVQQRQLTRKLIAGFSVLFIACLAVPFYIYTNDVKQKQDISGKMTAAEAGKAITDKAKADAASTRSQIQPIQDKVDFVAAVHKHNQDIVNFWSTVAAYSSGSKVIYSDAVVSGTPPVLTIKAYAPSIAEIGRYLQAMYNEPDFKSVGIDKLPGYPEAVVNKYYYNNKLVLVGTSAGNASGNTTGGNTGTNATGGATITYGTPATPGPAGFGINVPVINDNNAQAGSAGTAQAGQTQAFGGRFRINVPLLSQALANDPVFNANYNSEVNPFAPPSVRTQMLLRVVNAVKVRQEPQGFPVTITATLNQPLTPPTVPGAAPATPGP